MFAVVCWPYLHQCCTWALTPSILKLKLTSQSQLPHRSFQLPNTSVFWCHVLWVRTISRPRSNYHNSKRNYGPFEPVSSALEVSIPSPSLLESSQSSIDQFVILWAIFLVLFAYALDSLFQQFGHTHKMKILQVHYDGGNMELAIVSALSAACPSIAD
jgi:hypothetical protein